MEKVEMLIDGKRALVDQDMVKLIKKKQVLLQIAAEIKQKASSMTPAEHTSKMSDIVTKIIRLNRRIRPCVKFI